MLERMQRDLAKEKLRNKKTVEKGFKIGFSLACKLASIAVHVDEATGPDGHPFDTIAMRALAQDAEVQGWIKSLGALAPLKRKALS